MFYHMRSDIVFDKFYYFRQCCRCKEIEWVSIWDPKFKEKTGFDRNVKN